MANDMSYQKVESLPNPMAEDPKREAREKEMGLHLEGDAMRYSITSFKKVIFSKILNHEDFQIKRLHLLNADGQEYTVDSLKEAATTPTDSIIGVEGWLPVGSLTIGKSRVNDSQANIVK